MSYIQNTLNFDFWIGLFIMVPTFPILFCFIRNVLKEPIDDNCDNFEVINKIHKQYRCILIFIGMLAPFYSDKVFSLEGGFNLFYWLLYSALSSVTLIILPMILESLYRIENLYQKNKPKSETKCFNTFFSKKKTQKQENTK